MHPLIQILRFTKTLWRHYLGIIISATITAATALAVPFVIARATDVAVDGVRTGEQHMSTIMWLAGGSSDWTSPIPWQRMSMVGSVTS